MMSKNQTITSHTNLIHNIIAIITVVCAISCKPPGQSGPVKKDKTFDGPSTELGQTVVVPSLASELPGGKNVVWCSSFQLAWNGLKDDIIKEPVELAEHRELAELLNRPGPSKKDIGPDDYYANAGLVADGIIETIQNDMRKKFPEEPVPDFGDIGPATAVVSYSFLSANVRFKMPYFENDQKLVFVDSSGRETPVRSFGIREKDDYAYYKLREQLEILFRDYEPDFKLKECAIDLCAKSRPNQIVIAMVEPRATLADTVAYIDQKAGPKAERGYMSRFGPNDVLLVPNLFWKIVHDYAELEGNHLENDKFKGYPIEKARQVIQFRLDRSGAELKSESKMYCLPMPTYFVFDRPFLIYMKKRGAEYPYFVMWIDNAELLEQY